MKNLHIIRTDKPSRLVTSILDTINNDLFLTTTKDFGTKIMQFQNIYITSDEEIKEGSLYLNDKVIFKADDIFNEGNNPNNSNPRVTDFNKKIILTTDQDLIKDGVQAIDDEFLEWFVNNPTCDHIKTEKWLDDEGKVIYSIIIPKEEQKQHLIDMMRGDEELGLYDNNTEIGMHTLTDTTTGCNSSRFGKQETLEEFKKRFANNKSNKDIKLDYQDGIYYGIEVGANWQAKRMYSEEQVNELIGLLKQTTEYEVLQSFRDKVDQFKKK